MRAVAGVVVILSVLGAAQALDASTIFPELLSSLTGGLGNGTSGTPYLYSVASELATGFESSLTDLYSQLVGNDTLDLSKQDVIQGLISQWKDKFCTEAVYTPASKNPASFTGPGFSVSLSGGACMFNDELFSSGSGEIEIDCVGPSVTVKKTPAVFVSKSNDPETFVSSYCSISSVLEDKIEDVFAKNITFGKSKDTSTTTEVLYVFDKKIDDLVGVANLTASTTSSSSGLDTGSITDLVQNAFMTALGLVNNPVSAVSSFVSNLGSDAQSAINNITSATGPEVNTLLQVLAGK